LDLEKIKRWYQRMEQNLDERANVMMLRNPLVPGQLMEGHRITTEEQMSARLNIRTAPPSLLHPRL
jgi:hypothetical protein